MAFVSESPRNTVGHIRGSASGQLGPGEYHNEGQLHRMAMDAIYPKKLVPFNSQMNRGVVDKNVSISHTQTTPGPGEYKAKSDFDLNKYVREMDERGTYLTIDNGHLNQKKQMYAKLTGKKIQIQNAAQATSQARKDFVTPGPGSYETNRSSVANEQLTRQLVLQGQSKNNLMQSSPSSNANALTQVSTNHQSFQKMKLNNLSIPSIPSRFLTPVLKFDLYEKDQDGSTNYLDDNYNIVQQPDGSIESILVAKVARLTNDGSALGPGQYNVDQSSKAMAKSPRGAIMWKDSKSTRPENFIKTFTDRVVGPGSYSNEQQIQRRITNPTIARAKHISRTFYSQNKPKTIKNKGSIRDNFEEDSDEENPLKIGPGPGSYLKHHHTSYIGQSPIIHRHPQNFGTIVERFKEPHPAVATQLGPGQYVSQNKQAKAHEKYLPKLQSCFTSAHRTDLAINKFMLETPGPSEYIGDITRDIGKNLAGGDKRPFNVNTNRFGSDENGIPGAGTYKLPDSCQVKQPKHTLASYKSSVEKGLNYIVIGPENPGIGEYDTQHLRTIQNKELQGGCANNFSLFTRLKYQGRSPDVKTSPRLPADEQIDRTPQAIGPGSYIDKKSKTYGKFSQGPTMATSAGQTKYSKNNLSFGTQPRFNFEPAKTTTLGPGQYNDTNKWNKRTYNLKFLNFQAHALGNNQSPSVHHRSQSVDYQPQHFGGESHAFNQTQPLAKVNGSPQAAMANPQLQTISK